MIVFVALVLVGVALAGLLAPVFRGLAFLVGLVVVCLLLTGPLHALVTGLSIVLDVILYGALALGAVAVLTVLWRLGGRRAWRRTRRVG